MRWDVVGLDKGRGVGRGQEERVNGELGGEEEDGGIGCGREWRRRMGGVMCR